MFNGRINRNPTTHTADITAWENSVVENNPTPHNDYVTRSAKRAFSNANT